MLAQFNHEVLSKHLKQSVNVSAGLQPTVRLVGRPGMDGVGFVEVRDTRTFQWGFVCDDGWNENNAKVVCQQLCFE